MKKYKFISCMAFLFLILCIMAPNQSFATPETLTSLRGGANFPVAGVGHGGSLKTAHGRYLLAANVEDGDIFEMCRIPAGATVVGGIFYADDIDTGATAETLDMDVGWAATKSRPKDADGLLNPGVLTGDAVTGYKPETGTLMPLAGLIMTQGEIQFTEETLIQVEANAGTTDLGAFSSGYIGVIIHYLMEN